MSEFEFNEEFEKKLEKDFFGEDPEFDKASSDFVRFVMEDGSVTIN